MSVEDNKALYRRWIEEGFVKKNVNAAVEEYIHPNAIDHTAPPGTPPGPEGTKQQLRNYFTAFPDLRPTITDLISEGDKVVALITFEGTHKGPFMGIPPTGKRTTTSGIDVARISNGKFVEHWFQADFVGLLQQLGALPGLGQ